MSPARVTEDRKPADWRASVSRRIWFVEGTEVRPRRAFEAFWRWEQTFERCTRDMIAFLVMSVEGEVGKECRGSRPRVGASCGLDQFGK